MLVAAAVLIGLRNTKRAFGCEIALLTNCFVSILILLLTALVVFACFLASHGLNGFIYDIFLSEKTYYSICCEGTSSVNCVLDLSVANSLETSPFLVSADFCSLKFHFLIKVLPPISDSCLSIKLRRTWIASAYIVQCRK